MADPALAKMPVFLLCSGSGDAYTASAFLSQAEAEEAAARMIATLLAKSPDAVDVRTWRHELEGLNRLYCRIGQPQQHISIVSDELQIEPELITKVDGLSWTQRLFWRWLSKSAPPKATPKLTTADCLPSALIGHKALHQPRVSNS
jgi:hypothetical protein